LRLVISRYRRLRDCARRRRAAAGPGFGVETALTIDLYRIGMRITEVEVPLAHRATGGDWRAQVHRARQFADVARTLAVRKPIARAPRTAQG